MAQTDEEKAARAQRELDKLERLTKKAADLRKKMIKDRENAAASPPVDTVTASHAVNNEPDVKPDVEEPESELIRRARAIGISEEERAAHALELEAEEEQRLAEPKSAKQARAQKELEKLNRRAAQGNKGKKDKSKKKKNKKKTQSKAKTEL